MQWSKCRIHLKMTELPVLGEGIFVDLIASDMFKFQAVDD